MCCEIAFFKGFGRQKKIVTFPKKEPNRFLARRSEILSSALYRYLVVPEPKSFIRGKLYSAFIFCALTTHASTDLQTSYLYDVCTESCTPNFLLVFGLKLKIFKNVAATLHSSAAALGSACGVSGCCCFATAAGR